MGGGVQARGKLYNTAGVASSGANQGMRIKPGGQKLKRGKVLAPGIALFFGEDLGV